MRRTFLAAFCLLFSLNQVVTAGDFRFSPHANKAHLIQWRAWNRSSLDEARGQNKPVLLSLSAVWCHWCHVMDETTYSDPVVISFINENLVPIRVDSDMRPDIDSLYNQGGWPSTLVLTPGGEIIQGGTYIVPEEMVAWMMKAVAAYKGGKPDNEGEAGNAKEEKGLGSVAAPPAKSGIEKTVGYLKSEYDKEHGGFGRSQKFPNPDAIDFLLSEVVRGRDDEAASMVTRTLDEMARGEIRDAVEGGFFRYATGSDWSAPHYEKMLEVNAGIARNYAFAYQVFGKPLYRSILKETLTYVSKSLFDRKKGVFYGSQDADEKYYAAAKRNGPTRPYVDTTVYAGPNARMISALIAAYGATGSTDFLKDAMRTADFMIRRLYSREGGVYRSFRDGDRQLEGLLADNVLCGLALIDLYNVTGKSEFIVLAQEIGRLLEKRFFDPENGRFRPSLDTTIVGPSTPGRLHDYEMARANFEAAVFLERLYRYNGDRSLKQVADAVIARLDRGCERFGPAAPVCGSALRWEIQEPFEVVVVSRDRPGRFLSEVNRVFIPEKVVKVLSLKKDREEVKRLGYPVEEALYVCSGRRCLASVKRPQEVRKRLKKFMKSLVPFSVHVM
jgi:uncharacterized protein YyaL (SSP411 family)